MAAPLLAVDAPFLLYRSFFALPESITGIDGRPVGALLGATNAILRVAAEREPRAVVFCFGAEAAEYRVKLYPPYHADRPPVPEALAWQIRRRAGAVRGVRMELAVLGRVRSRRSAGVSGHRGERGREHGADPHR